MIVDVVQRWTLGREYRRPAGELIKTSEYDVEPIESSAVAREFVALHHYAKDASSDAHRFGLYRFGELVGVALFGPPASEAARRKVFPTLSNAKGVTLGRLVLLEDVPGNGESWFVARTFELLRDRGVVAIESCADPVVRTDADGRMVLRGHAGTIYQALNSRYVGKTNPSTLRLLPDGTVFSNRAAGKIRKGERGAARAVNKLVSYGADALDVTAPRAERLAWLRHWISRLTRPLRHHGNHRYLWCLDKRHRCEVLDRHDAKPYPKIGFPKIALERAA